MNYLTLTGRITGMAPNGGLQRDIIAHLAGCHGPPQRGTGARRMRFHIPAQHLDTDIPPRGTYRSR